MMWSDFKIGDTFVLDREEYTFDVFAILKKEGELLDVINLLTGEFHKSWLYAHARVPKGYFVIRDGEQICET